MYCLESDDSKRNAAKRLLKGGGHPRLKVILSEDALSFNTPDIRNLQMYGCYFILCGQRER
jgi:hypothetical protein